MGNKLDKPITNKTSFDGENEMLKYGMSEMQSFKNSMELFTLKNTNLLEQNKKISLFGIFDGHNGSEISKYLSLHFSQFLSENKKFINGDYKQALKETFINIDNSLRALEVQKEISKFSTKNSLNFSELNLKEEENKNISNFLELFNPRNLEGANIAEFCGSCGIIVLVTEKNVYIANSGNSKCIPINIKNEIMKDKINKEHIITDQNEINRLKLAYGFVEEENDNIFDNNETNEKIKFKPINYCPLIITRGFGDLIYKDIKLIKQEDQYISVNPDIIEVPIDELGYMIIGNNEVFDETIDNNKDNNYNIVKFFFEKNKNNKKISEIIEEFFDENISKKEKNKQIENMINNIGCIIIEFKHDNNTINVDENNENRSAKESENKINDKNNKNEDEVEEEENQ